MIEHKPRRIPYPKGHELIKKVWQADPLLCPKCSREMRIVALIDEREVIERILRHLELWEQGVRIFAARGPPEPADWVIEPCLELTRSQRHEIIPHLNVISLVKNSIRKSGC